MNDTFEFDFMPMGLAIKMLAIRRALQENSLQSNLILLPDIYNQ